VKGSSPAEARIIALIEPAAEELGYRLVRVRLSGLKRKRLQIMAERAVDGQMGLGDCERLSRTISPILEAADPISSEYDFEMSSPGIDRPLVRLEDFERFAGHEAKLETGLMIDGRKRFKGVLGGVDGEDVLVRLPEGEVRLPFSALADARLVLTDRLIELDLKRAKAAQAAEAHETPPPQSGGGASEASGRGVAVGASPLSQSAARPDSSPVNGGANKKRKER
jgi:ribosome maturation factor RimP